MRPVTLVEVAPRDGFQAVRAPIPTARKVEAVRALHVAGFGRIEIGAFVSPRALPQMADISEVWAGVRDLLLRACVLVPNARGAELALKAGLTELVFVVSVSEAHNRENVARSVEQSVAELRAVTGLLDGLEGAFLRLNLATSFDCPFEGAIHPDRVLALAERLAPLRGQIEFGICDTTGRANPGGVRGLFERLASHLGEGQKDGIDWAFHGHDTYGLGVANALYAFDAGVRVFDAAAGGLGGCPFAPGASGNTAAEDLVFTLEGMGVPTGIDLERLLRAADLIAALDPPSSGGHLTRVPRARALAPTRVA